MEGKIWKRFLAQQALLIDVVASKGFRFSGKRVREMLPSVQEGMAITRQLSGTAKRHVAFDQDFGISQHLSGQLILDPSQLLYIGPSVAFYPL